MRFTSFSTALLLGAAMIASPMVGAQADVAVDTDGTSDQTLFSTAYSAKPAGEVTDDSTFSGNFSSDKLQSPQRNSQFLTLAPSAPAQPQAGEQPTQPTEPQAGEKPPQPAVPEPQPDPEPQAELEFTPVDLDSDGKVDGWAADRNGDGYFDVVLIDDDGDGQADYALFDDNFNGVIDAKFVPATDDKGNRVDVHLFDDDEDGKFEYIGFDWDLDGVIDEWRQV